MSLNAILDKATFDTLPAEMQEHYIPDPDNAEQHNLQVIAGGGLELVNSVGLKKALQTERGSVTTLKAQLKAFEGIKDPAAALAALAKIEELGDRIDKLDDPALKKELEDHKAQLTAKFESDTKQLTTKHQTEVDKLTATNKTLHSQLTDNLISSAATKAIADEKGSVELLLPLVKSMMRMKETEGGSLIAVVVDADGTERISPKSGSTEPMKVDELVATMKADPKYGRAFDGTKSSGSGASGAGDTTGAGGSTMVLSAVDAKDPVKYRAAKEAAAKAGRQLQIAD